MNDGFVLSATDFSACCMNAFAEVRSPIRWRLVSDHALNLRDREHLAGARPMAGATEIVDHAYERRTAIEPRQMRMLADRALVLLEAALRRSNDRLLFLDRLQSCVLAGADD